MKKNILTLILFIPFFLFAQVGINTESPRALLDVKAQNENALTNAAGVMVTEDGLLIPRVTTLLLDGDQPLGGVLVYLTTTFTDTTPDPDVTYDPGFYVSYGSSWETLGGGTTESLGQLRLVDEGNGNGYRLNNVTPANYGNIGFFSKDFSLQQEASSTRGATGVASFVGGVNTTASGINSLAFGAESIASALNTAAFGFSTVASGQTSMAVGDDTEAKASGSMAVGISNTDYTVNDDGTDRLFIVGNGVSRGTRSDAFIVQLDGTITAPSFDISEITEDKSLITKEYFDINNTSGQVVTQVSGGNTGYRIAANNPNNFQPIGNFAINLGFRVPTFANNIDNTYGATNRYAFAVGANNLASGVSSVAIGGLNVATGNTSVAAGGGLIARAFGTVALGAWNTDFTPVGGANSRDGSDRVLIIGNGINGDNRSDGLVILRNGTITAPSFDISEITDNKALITKEYFDANNSSSTTPGLELITESVNTGYRRSDAIATNYGDIGNNSVDLSLSDLASTTFGATGFSSLATGNRTIASGTFSFTSGSNTIASGNTSVAMGVDSEATGDFSVAIGIELLATAYGSTVFGNFNDPGTAIDATFPENGDQIFSVGNGSSELNRSNALTILRNGTITAPSLSVAEIDTAGNTALITKEFTDENYIARLPSGNTAARPVTAPAFGTMRYNTQTGRPEVYVENSTDVAEGNTYIPGWIRL